ncbi:MAG TPA: histidine kinase [Accumulibacter sp.]|jgi:hypothetical protein|nr:histidine kinase [Accumulibacter sp.]
MNEADIDVSAFRREPNTILRATLRLSLIYWACMFVADSVLGYFINIDPVESAPLKFVLYGLSALMTYAMSMLLFRMRRLSFVQKALLNFALSAVGAPIYTAIDFMNYTLCQYPKPVTFDPVYSGYTLIEGASQLFGWCCLFTAFLYHFEVRDRERRLAAIREEALTAKMHALHYQINPHFLFNTLNSIAELIKEGSGTQAERMVLSLATFLRTTLSLDPMHDTLLADEIALQQDYLAIERERFSDRMTFTIKMPEEVSDALVPSLILQPLIENAIKHGVSASADPVEIALQASHQAGRLRIMVENDVPDDGTETILRQGMGLGLRNVAERLRLRLQGEANVSFGLVTPRRFRVAIDLPWRSA